MLLLKLILDTNVIVSAHLAPKGLERVVLIMALSHPAELLVSPEILAEYEEVLRRRKFRLNPESVEQSLALIKTRAVLVQPTVVLSPE